MAAKPAAAAAASPKSPEVKSPPSGVAQSKSFEFESSPPANVEIDDDDKEMKMTLAAPPVGCRGDEAWRSYATAGYITVAEAGFLRDLQTAAADDIEGQLGERGAHLIQIMLKLISSVNDAPARKYILTLVDNLCFWNKRKFAPLFIAHVRPDDAPSSLGAGQQKEDKKDVKQKPAAAPASALNPFAPFFQLLKQETLDQYSQARVLHILATLFAYGGGITGKNGAVFEELTALLKYLIGKLGTARGKELMLVLLTAKEVLKNPEVRRPFVEAGGLKSLEMHFRHENETFNTQVSYVSAFIVWLLSYNASSLPELKQWAVVPRVYKMVSNTQREKVLRLGFAICVNLAGKEGYNEELIAQQMIKFIDSLSGRKLKDEDLPKDIEELRKALEESLHALSSYEKYTSEVDSGRLVWSPVHSEQFWRENNQRFEEKSFDYIRKLIQLLDSHDELTLIVACSDLGEFARFHPDGKTVIGRHGGKKQLMTLMSSKSSAARVQSAALLAVQKLMVTNWEHLNPGSKKAANKEDS